MKTFVVRPISQHLANFEITGREIEGHQEKIVIRGEDNSIIFIASNEHVIVHEKQG
ncbi:hypothetical protein [Fulvivirga imtechensis]|uniref:hypothetical protein n=1 Tax=Fulvivirga imtechensis TaxID=881893 RepID=UPI0012F96E7B|nr:hypothetical protein [Fulvivirga imtechensis]